MGRSTWILQKKDTVLAAYYIHSTDVIPPRFNWNTANAQAPGMIRMCILVSSYYPGHNRCSIIIFSVDCCFIQQTNQIQLLN